eukprot:CAMPEP_0185912734 /NCGR_PEP_ID=MMETSP0196C-20130402/41505_1 /TAXON_ID=2932 /ORGANISM="Alexandrium fundyense, Strain CCMP1719" /LENGTH=34 /DNA_ID= /DNA_START= /DNA_END= /DNA_ORIENTATION=
MRRPSSDVQRDAALQSIDDVLSSMRANASDAEMQ